MKTTFNLIVGLGILVAGISDVAHAGGGYSCNSSRAVVVTQPYRVQHSGGCSYYRYQTYPQSSSWRYGYSKAKGYYGTGYRYNKSYRCR